MIIPKFRLALLLLLSLTLQLTAFAREVFPDGTPIPDWFRQNKPTDITKLGKQYRITDFNVTNDSTIIQTQLLQAVIATVAMETKPQMVADTARQAPDIAHGWKNVAPEVAAEETAEKPDEEGGGKQPGKEEMDHPSGRQILIGGQRRPGGKAAIGRIVIRPAHAEKTRCREIAAKDRGKTIDRAVRIPHRPHGQDPVVEFEAGLVADVERGMSIEDLQSAQEQEKQRDRPGPVRQPGRGPVPIDHPAAVVRWRALRLNVVDHVHPILPLRST